MPSPATVRTTAARGFATRQLLSSPLGGINRLAEFLRSSPGAFSTWQKNPVTRVVIDALLPMSLNPDLPGCKSDELSAQYGVSQGLMLAYQLCTDPQGILGVETVEEEKARVDLSDIPSDYLPPPELVEQMTDEEKALYGLSK